MSRRFDLIVFDWDGTLVDSSQVIVDSIQAATRDAGLPVPDAAAVRGIIGLSLRPAIGRLFAGIELPEDRLVQMTERYAWHFRQRDHGIRLFEGVAATLRELAGAGYLLAVATGKGRRGLEHALDSSGLRPYFLASRCADECHSKPHPQMLHELMDELGACAARSLMVGDTSHDLMMARNAGMASLAVTHGAQPLEHLLPHAPLAHFDRFTALREWLSEKG